MHSFQSIPNRIVFLGCHPTRSNKKIKDEIHRKKQKDQIEDLHN